MNIDVLTTGVAVFSFGSFLLVHMITFRRVRPEHLLRSLLVCVIAIMGLPAVLMGMFYILKVLVMPYEAWASAVLLAMLLQGLLCFVYVLCIFGPYETSVRMRLVREIAKGGSTGITLKELSVQYNAGTIVDIRLQRLIGSGDIIEENGRYRIGRSGNFFFIFDAIAAVIKRWIGR
jgi:hypothetical protein